MKSNQLPPQMKGIPFFGNILQFLKSPRDYFIDCHKHHGDLIRVNTPLGPVTIIFGRLCKKLIDNETANGISRKGLFKAFSTEVGVDIFEDADEEHQAGREFVKLPYSRYITAQFVPEIGNVVQSFTDHLYNNQEIELFEFCTEVTLSSVMVTATPICQRDLLPQFFPYADRVMDIITQKLPHFTSYFPIYKKNKLAVHNRIDEIIKRHASGEFSDNDKMFVVDAVLKNLGKEELNDKELSAARGVMVYLLAGSVVYTSRLVFFYMFEILKNRSLMDKIQDEIQMAFGEGEIDSKMFRKMPYLRSTFMEVLRMFPLLPGLPFQTTRKVNIEEYQLPKGEKIIFVPHSEHFLEENYRDPYHFNSDRFHPNNKSRFKPNTFFPYGISKRTCAAMGSMEVFTMTILVNLLRSRQWKLVSPSQEYQLKLNPLIGPDRPIKVIHAGKISNRELSRESHHLSEALDFVSPFENHEIEKVLPKGIHCSYPAGTEIISQGDEPKDFFIISSGEVEVIKDGVKVAELKEGESFGELGLLKNIPRTASVKAIDEVNTIRLTKEEFFKIIVDLDVENGELRTRLHRHFLEVNIKNSLPRLDQEQLKEVLSDYNIKHFTKGDIIINQGEPAASFFIILTGSVTVYSIEEQERLNLATLNQGEIFGELGIINQSPRSASIEAAQSVTVIEIERKYLLEIMEGSKDIQEDLFSIIFQRISKNIKQGRQNEG